MNVQIKSIQSNLELDDEVVSTTGFRGIVIGIEYDFSRPECARILVQPRCAKDEIGLDPLWFNEPQLAKWTKRVT